MIKPRRPKYITALSAKKPRNGRTHVGVELEFCSESPRNEIALTLARNGVAGFCHLKSDCSVKSENGSGECDGSCLDECECYNCGETHTCDDQRSCDRRTRNYEGGATHWEFRPDCEDCQVRTRFEVSIFPKTYGRVVCRGHCSGHSCNGSDDHGSRNCSCECNCTGKNEGHELALVCGLRSSKQVLSKVCAALAEHAPEINDTCGLHVHLDIRGKDAPKAFANLVASQSLLYCLVPKSRRNSSFCKPNGSLDFSSYGSDRYLGINPNSLAKHQTLEIRIHSGTVSASKINFWIELCSAIAYAPNDLKAYKTLSKFLSQLKLSAPLIEYIRERLAKFKTQHSSWNLRFTDDLTNEAPLTSTQPQAPSFEAPLAA